MPSNTSEETRTTLLGAFHSRLMYRLRSRSILGYQPRITWLVSLSRAYSAHAVAGWQAYRPILAERLAYYSPVRPPYRSVCRVTLSLRCINKGPGHYRGNSDQLSRHESCSDDRKQASNPRQHTIRSIVAERQDHVYAPFETPSLCKRSTEPLMRHAVPPHIRALA